MQNEMIKVDYNLPKDAKLENDGQESVLRQENSIHDGEIDIGFFESHIMSKGKSLSTTREQDLKRPRKEFGG